MDGLDARSNMVSHPLAFSPSRRCKYRARAKDCECLASWRQDLAFLVPWHVLALAIPAVARSSLVL